MLWDKDGDYSGHGIIRGWERKAKIKFLKRLKVYQ
jgi:hypothetical protein